MTGDGVVRRTVAVGPYTVSYLEAGAADAPTVLLLHGLASDCTTWDKAVEPLAGHGLHVVAVDLLGHGESDKPPTGYLLDDFAAMLAQFLQAIGVRSATVCGHSLGGAIAVHFAYHYPQYVQRLVLVSAGGLGREVHPMLRAAAIPGSERVLAAVTARPMWRLYRNPRVHRLLRLTPDNVINLRRAGRTLRDRDGRDAFFAALRGVIEPAGQRGSFAEMKYLQEHIPTMLVWSEADGVIPVRHAYATRDHLPRSELVVFPGTGHEPHRRHAADFSAELARFIAGSAPAV